MFVLLGGEEETGFNLCHRANEDTKKEYVFSREESTYSFLMS